MKKIPFFFFFLVLLSSFSLADYASSGDHNFAMLPVDNAFYGETASGDGFNITITASSDFATDGANNLPMELFYSLAVVVSCGDGTCNAGETCSTCPADCGVCTQGSGIVSTTTLICGVDNNNFIIVTPITGNSLKADGTTGEAVGFKVSNVSKCKVKVDMGSSDNIGRYLRFSEASFELNPDENKEVLVYSTEGKAIEPFNLAGDVVFTAKTTEGEQIITKGISLFRDFWWLLIIIGAIVVFFYLIFIRKKKKKSYVTYQPAAS